jgi:hypothetical protein
VHKYVSESVAAECTLSDSFHCIDALLTPGAIQEFLAYLSSISQPACPPALACSWVVVHHHVN